MQMLFLKEFLKASCGNLRTEDVNELKGLLTVLQTNKNKKPAAAVAAAPVASAPAKKAAPAKAKPDLNKGGWKDRDGVEPLDEYSGRGATGGRLYSNDADEYDFM
eukprot:TRINITY_DN220_c0_g1_i1.p1 TRINITY_DN220_c0_g1~~TRINITY_DN220_c0_g1_i1.p1  ORF type:complete len:105 (-),score=51.31 TRINITY_DN220_c0_g1_i1:272-586(-)